MGSYKMKFFEFEFEFESFIKVLLNIALKISYKIVALFTENYPSFTCWLQLFTLMQTSVTVM